METMNDGSIDDAVRVKRPALIASLQKRGQKGTSLSKQFILNASKDPEIGFLF